MDPRLFGVAPLICALALALACGRTPLGDDEHDAGTDGDAGSGHATRTGSGDATGGDDSDGGTPACAPGPWTLEAIAESELPGAISIALAPEGSPHVAYQLADALAHASRRDGGAWSREMIEQAPGTGWTPDIAVGGDGRVHVVYGGGAPPSPPRYAWRDDGWSVDASLTAIAYAPRLALSGDHDVYLAYERVGPEDAAIVVGRRSEDGWALDELAAITGAGVDVEFAIARDGHAHLAYTPFWNAMDLVYATTPFLDGDVNPWTFETLYAQVPNGLAAALALDAGGAPHLAHRYGDAGADTWQLRYAYQRDDAWTFELALDALTIGCVALAVDDAGRPHVIYTASERPGLHHAERGDAGWTSTTITDDDVATYSCDLAAFGATSLHAAYHATREGVYHYARRELCDTR